jgi:hypothetical protein
LLVLFNLFFIVGFAGAVARQLRIHSSRVRDNSQIVDKPYQDRMHDRN